jgi:C4-dicarboxylate-specific signal transduction histidine kinase
VPGGACVWPPRLSYLRMACAADEVASTLRHEALNEIAGLGALIYRLRRRLEAHKEIETEIAPLLAALEGRLGSSPTRLATRFLTTPQGGDSTDLPAAMKDLVTLLRTLSGAPVPVEVMSALTPAESPMVAVALPELQVAVGCLLENALEAHERTGTRAPVLITVRAERDRRLVEVRDHGPPLDPGLLEKLLDPFFTTEPGHSGLGLKIARRIVHRWNGELLIGQDPDADKPGLKVELALPAA